MSGNETFTKWLNDKLRELNTDESVFCSYISGILEGDETQEEKSEALNGILSEIIESNIDDLTTLILTKWLECQPTAEQQESKAHTTIDVNEKLAQLLEAQKLQPALKERQYTEEERRIKEQILAQYSQTEVPNEDLDDEAEEAEKQTSTANSLGGVERNTNFSDVVALQKERREQARQDSAAKKVKDKEDREKQRQMREEKKEKRKTVKGERRR